VELEPLRPRAEGCLLLALAHESSVQLAMGGPEIWHDQLVEAWYHPLCPHRPTRGTLIKGNRRRRPGLGLEGDRGVLLVRRRVRPEHAGPKKVKVCSKR